MSHIESSTQSIQAYSGYPKCAVQAVMLASQVALVVLGTLALLHIGSGWMIGTSMSAAITPTLLCYLCNRSSQKEPGAILQQYIIGIVGITIAVLGITGTLGTTQLGIAALSLAGASFIIGVCTGRSAVKKVEYHTIDEEGTLLADESFSSSSAYLCVQFVRKIMGVLKDISFTSGTFFSRITHKKNYAAQIQPLDQEDALCVLIHGLNGHPSIFDAYHDSFFSPLMTKNITIYQPHVFKKGRCKLEEATQPILEQISQWASQHPNRPIVLIGVSNGARISGYLASQFRLQKKLTNPLHVSCIAGPFNGTKMVNQPDFPSPVRGVWQWAFRKMHTDVVFDEHSWESTKSKKVIAGIQKTAKTANTVFKFYTTYGDTNIVPFRSACPVATGATYYSVATEGHNSIVRSTRDSIVEASLDFIQRY